MADKAELLKELYPEDNFNIGDNLTDGEVEVLYELSQSLEKHLRPVIDEYWEKGETPFEQFKAVVNDVNYLKDPRVYQTEGLFNTSQYYTFFLAYELSRFDVSISTFSGDHSGLGFYTFLLVGNDEQRERWCEKILDFELQTCFALTEPEHGSDVAGGLETVAKKDGDKWILNGHKRWIGGATTADIIPVFAKDADTGDVKCFVVEKGQEGLEIEKIGGKISLRMVENADFTLNNVEVKEENRLQNINSFKDVAKVLYITRSGVAFSATGMMAGALEATLKYVKERKQFGRPIAKFQLIQEKIAVMKANLTASLALCDQIVKQQEKGNFDEVNSSIGKLFISQRLRESVAAGRAACGGNGITLERGIARFFADAEAIFTYEGSYEMNALIIGRSLTGHSAFV